MLPILADLFGKDSPIGQVVNKVLDFIPDPQKKAEAQLKLQQELDANSQAILDALTSVDKAQAETNTEEAKSPNFWIAGARPAAMWVCVVSLALYFWPRFILGMFFWSRLAWHSQQLPVLPDLGVGDVLGMISPLLGIGGYRMMEKKWGVHDQH